MNGRNGYIAGRSLCEAVQRAVSGVQDENYSYAYVMSSSYLRLVQKTKRYTRLISIMLLTYRFYSVWLTQSQSIDPEKASAHPEYNPLTFTPHLPPSPRLVPTQVLWPEANGGQEAAEDHRVFVQGDEVGRAEDEADPEGGGHHRQHQQGAARALVRALPLVHIVRKLPR